MGLLLNTQSVSKQYGAKPLFESISFTISDGDRIGLIGPNGAGKSTLLSILAGRTTPDSGDVVVRKQVRVSYVAQESSFAPGLTIRDILHGATPEADAGELLARVSETSGRVGFEDTDAEAASLSGGWRKRLAIAEALMTSPDVLLLDEPTNHLDLGGIIWLERLLKEARFAAVVVSHDRYFLENTSSQIIELDRAYVNGLFRADGNYSRFLELKEEFLAAQARHQSALANRVRTEVEWLRRGPKARATKAKARIDNAHGLIAELSDLSSRSRTASAGIDFTASDRRTKRLIDAEALSFAIGGADGGTRTLFRDLSFTIGPGQRIGLVGPNGSGKTTMLRLLLGELTPASGGIRRADNLRIVYFDQNRARLDLDSSLRRALAPDGDSVSFRDQVIHVASWAARFLFAKEQLDQPVSRLSGGERARVLIANLIRQPADVLLLDEPTNDLDIPTLEVLEDNLLEFTGALVLVTHDRYLLDRVSTTVLGLDGQGGAEQFADYSQWEAWQFARRGASDRPASKSNGSREIAAPGSGPKKKLSYLEAREWESIEQRIVESEQALAVSQAKLQDPAITADSRSLERTYSDMLSAQQAVDLLYTRWAELEAKLSS